MAQSIEESLLQAIKRDDIKAFNSLTEKTPNGAYRLGRFSVLSLLYLYRSRKILSLYEAKLIKIVDCKELREPAEVSKKFSEKAGKCLRLYFNEAVSPLEMLLILDNIKRLKRIYPMAKPSEKVKQRLKSIYAIKYSLGIQFEGDEIVIEKRPLSYREKKKITTACLCSALAAVLAVGVPVTVVSLMPKQIPGEVTKLKHIDFTSANEYTLKQDIVLPANYSVPQVNCQIKGEGHKLIFGKGAALGELNGKLSDLIIESAGDAVFTVVSETAAVQNVTVNVNAEAASNSAALFAVTNYGTLDGVTLNVSGKLNALAEGNDGTDELVFGGLVMNNSYKVNVETQMVYNGVVQNCAVNYSNFALVGEVSANAMYGGVVGFNSAYLLDCTVSGEIIADTFDVAGVCALNNGIVSGNVNEANLSQSSSDTSWNPIVAGVVIRNYYMIQNCENKGSVTSVSACEQSEEGRELTVTAAGIVYLNGIEGAVELSRNSGAIIAKGSDTAYAGGIAAVLYARILNCISNSEITVIAKNVYAGGIVASSEVTPYGNSIYFGVAESCISQDRISVTVLGSAPACVGGIAGRVCELSVNNTALYVGGGVTNCYFTGECLSNVSYFGSIVGVCGASIYENNVYTSQGVEYRHFNDNYYSENTSHALGATVTGEEKYAEAADKGAAFMPLEDMKASKGYQDILSAFESET